MAPASTIFFVMVATFMIISASVGARITRFGMTCLGWFCCEVEMKQSGSSKEVVGGGGKMLWMILVNNER